jgi:hypothetical protein
VYRVLRPIVLVTVGAALASCDAGSVQILEPTGTSSGLGALALSVVVDSADAASGAALGWSTGVPGATVRYTRVDQDRFNWVDARTDSTGRALLSGLQPGQYWVTAERQVSGAQADALPYGTGSPRAFGGGQQFEVSARDTVSGVVPVELDRAGTLVLSEVYLTDPILYLHFTYWYDWYLELYNNSDQVQYLDGLVVGRGYLYPVDDSYFGHHSCAETESFRAGSHVWSIALWRLPGSGGRYPLAPGKTAVLAVSAVDHRKVLAALPDLSGAQFEFVPPGVADNPGVPNIAYLGPSFGDVTELTWFGSVWGGDGWFLARPLDISSLPTQRDPYLTNGPPYVGIPVEDVLDYVAVTQDPTTADVPFRGLTPYCSPTEPAAVDHLIAEIMSPGTSGDLTTSGQRRILRYVGGRAVLMDTNTSPVDWVNIPRTPGALPGGGGL